MAGDPVQQQTDRRAGAAAGGDEPGVVAHARAGGQELEVASGHVLDELALTPGWSVLHDVPWPGRPLASFDHVVVGPSGLFVIDAHSWSGRVTLTGEELRLDGRLRMDAVFGAATAAEAVASSVPGLDPEVVQPLVCLEREEWINGRIGDVTIATTLNLVPILKTRRRLLDAAAVETVVGELGAVIAAERERAIRGPVPPRTAHPPDHDADATPRPHRAPRSISWSGLLVRALVGLALGVGVVAVVDPGLLEPVRDFVTGVLEPDGASGSDQSE